MSAGRIVFFLVFAGGLIGSLHYYAWTRLVRDPQLGTPWAIIATWSIALLCALLVGAIPASFVLPRSAGAIVAWAAYIWMGFAFFLVVLLAATDLGRLAAGVTRSALGSPAIDAGRRLLLRRAIAAVVALGALGLGIGGLAEGLGRVRVKRIRIALRRLRPGRAGYKIVQLSDIHVGPTIGRRIHRAARRPDERARARSRS